MDNKKITVPEIITREWLKNVFEPMEEVAANSGDVFAKAKARMDMVRAGVLSIEDTGRIQHAREVFWAEDARREEIEEGDKKTAEKIAFLESAMMVAIPALIETAKKWDKKVFDRRFLDALSATENVYAHKLTYGNGVEITYCAGHVRHSTLACFYRLSDMVTEEDGKKPRINAAPIIKALEIKQEHLANDIGKVKQTKNEVESVRDLIAKMLYMKKGFQRYDRETLTAYGLDYYGLKELGI